MYLIAEGLTAIISKAIEIITNFHLVIMKELITFIIRNIDLINLKQTSKYTDTYAYI